MKRVSESNTVVYYNDQTVGNVLCYGTYCTPLRTAPRWLTVDGFWLRLLT